MYLVFLKWLSIYRRWSRNNRQSSNRGDAVTSLKIHVSLYMALPISNSVVSLKQQIATIYIFKTCSNSKHTLMLNVKVSRLWLCNNKILFVINILNCIF